MFIFFSHISPDRTHAMLRTSVQSYWILGFLIPLLFYCQVDCNLLLKRGTRLFSPPPSVNPRTLQFYMVTITCVYFLNITISYALFRTHSEYNRNALKKQYATFTTLTSPTLKVTFHHPSPLFWEHELQQTSIPTVDQLTSKTTIVAVTSAKLFHSNHHIHAGRQTEWPRCSAMFGSGAPHTHATASLVATRLAAN